MLNVKNLILLLIIALLLNACNESTSSGSSDVNFKITPDSLTKLDSPVNTSSVNYNSTTYNANYSIIYEGEINGTGYIGIALSDNPDPASETFNLKIYFPGDSIPDSKIITSDGDTVVKVITNGIIHSGLSGGSLTLNLSSSQVVETHGDSDSTNDTTYTIYNITSSGNINIDSLTLTDLNITALYVGSNS